MCKKLSAAENSRSRLVDPPSRLAHPGAAKPDDLVVLGHNTPLTKPGSRPGVRVRMLQPGCGKVALRLTVLRRLDWVLEPSRTEVLAKAKELEGKGIRNPDPVLASVAGEQSFNNSPFRRQASTLARQRESKKRMPNRSESRQQARRGAGQEGP